MGAKCSGKVVAGSVKEAIGEMTGNAELEAKGRASPGLRDEKPGSAELLPLHVERVSVGKRVRTTLVRAKLQTTTRDELVRANLTQHRVVVERVPIGRTVDAVPPVRQEGDVTVVPVVEEVVVIERRLMLKEEIHLRRVRTVEPYSETVTLREQQVTLTRTNIED